RDAVALREVLLFVDVHLHDLELVLVRDPVEDGGDRMARSAPLGPEVDDHLAVGLEDLVLERVSRSDGCQTSSFRFESCTGSKRVGRIVCSRSLLSASMFTP